MPRAFFYRDGGMALHGEGGMVPENRQGPAHRSRRINTKGPQGQKRPRTFPHRDGGILLHGGASCSAALSWGPCTDPAV